MKKKILVFMYSLHDGGAQRTIVNIINNIDKEKFEVFLVLGSDKNNVYEDFIDKNIHITYLNRNKLRYCIFDLIKLIKKEQPDLLFTTLNENNIILLLAKLFSFRRIPAVVREANNRTQSGNVTYINRFMTYFTYNYLAQMVVALSNGVKEDLVNNFRINKSKVEVIYNPVEVNQIKELSSKPVNDFKLKNKEKLIIAVGRLVEQKDYTTLLKAFNIVVQFIEKSRLIILGKGPQEEELKKLSKQLNIDDKVDFLGYKKNPYKYMKIADVFVLSSKWEGFGHVIVEAMATGTPVISTDCKSGPAEIMEDNTYGVLTPVGDYKALANEIISMLTDNEKRSRFSKLGQKRAEEFDAKTIVKKYEMLFFDALS